MDTIAYQPRLAVKLIGVTAVESSEEHTKHVGDLLFAAASLARCLKVDAESALRSTLLRYRQRFSHMESMARESGRPLSDLKPIEVDALWRETQQLL